MSDFKVWECIVCGVIYNEALGWPEEGLAPGTRWHDVPSDWLCPDCGVGKDDFEMAEVSLSQPSGMPGAATPQATPSSPPEPEPKVAASASAVQVYRQWECVVCGIIYDEAQGWPEDDIAPGTRWDDVPEDWLCPDCGVGKIDFEMLEVGQSATVVAPAVEAESAAEVVSDDAQPRVDETLDPIVIIGTGLAGYNLAREIRKLDSVTPITMITADDGSFYSKPQLSTGFAKDKSARQLSSASAEDMAGQLQARIHIFSSVTAIDAAAKTLTYEGRQLRYAKLVLAAGAECIAAPLSGDAAAQVYRVNDLMDYACFRTAAQGARRVLVIGAGLIGCEYANDLVAAGLEVEVVDPMPTPLASLLPAEAGRALQCGLQDAGVKFHLQTVVETLDYAGQGVVATLSNGNTIEADLVLSAIGVRARLQLAQLAGVETNRGILTNRYLGTSDEHIFAIGDCAEVDGHLLYYIAPLMAGSRALAKTLCGEPTEVCYGAMPVSVKTTCCPVTVAPAPRDAAGEWQIETLDQHSVRASFVSPAGDLLGFALTGSATAQKELVAERLPALMGGH